jgi:hypothetical protein
MCTSAPHDQHDTPMSSASPTSPMKKLMIRSDERGVERATHRRVHADLRGEAGTDQDRERVG